MWASSPTRVVGWFGLTGPEEYRGCGTMWASSPTRVVGWFGLTGPEEYRGLRDDVGIVPCAKKAKTRLALLGSAG